MFIGKKIFPKTSKEGTFYCPECRCTTGYELKEKTNYFCALWIPLLAMDTVGKYVECVECRNSFRENVLESSPETARAEFHPSMRRIMILMLLADGSIDETEIEIIKGIYARVSGYALTDEEIRDDIETASKEKLQVKEYLKKVTPYLNKTGKARVLKSAYYVASADGEFHDDERNLMEEISQALEMEPSHYKSIIDDINKSDEDPSDPIPII